MGTRHEFILAKIINIIHFLNSLHTYPLQKSVDVELPAQFTTCRAARNPDEYIRDLAFLRFARSFFQGQVYGTDKNDISERGAYGLVN